MSGGDFFSSPKSGAIKIIHEPSAAEPFVVLEKSETCTGGAHDDCTAFANVQAVGESFFERGENACGNALSVFASGFKPGLL